MRDPLRLERRLALLGAGLTLVEAVAIGGPLLALVPPGPEESWHLSRAVPLTLPGAWLVWWLVMRHFRAPLDHVLRALRAGAPIEAAALAAAVRATVILPQRAAITRTAVITVAALFLGVLLVNRTGLPARALFTAVSVATFHGVAIGVFRALGWARVLDRLRGTLRPDADVLRLFHALYRARLLRAALATGALAVVATATFAFLSLPLGRDHYLRLEIAFPPTIGLLTLVWWGVARRLCRPIESFLHAALDGGARARPLADEPSATAAFRAAQVLPYWLGAVKLVLAVAGAAILGALAVALLSVDVETAALLFGVGLVVTVGATVYEVLWHRATMRPLLAHLATGLRLPSIGARTPLGLRHKMLAGFGALTLFACGLSLFWSVVQYKTMATTFIQRETEIRCDRVAAEIAARPDGPIEDALAAAGGGGVLVFHLAPGAPWPRPVAAAASAGVALRARDVDAMRAGERGELDLAGAHLTGTFRRLTDSRGAALGTVAVLSPNYRGRGASLARPLQVLLFFFVLLVASSLGLVAMLASDLTYPIRLLERRAEAMARGDLARPVVSVSGELDEVGRLTLALEEMRRALDEKLRSSTEVNVALEQEVRRRTAELQRRNHELAHALDALRRAQAELVRSEKMASMGRLVAGIAHEINNPVNAVVNTVAPLEAALDGLAADGATPGELHAEAREMLRVIRSGARRTKEIVTALHNYSRGDETSQSEVDLHRGLDESLELLRHHLRNGIRVEKSYGEVGAVRGNPGQLHQVFMNLLTNAAQAIGDRAEGGTVRLSTEREGGTILVRVADDGPGIPDDALPHIFDPFFTTKDVGEGSGLGLSIVHGIVERHGGSIDVASRPGEGTTFTVRLPAAETDAADR